MIFTRPAARSGLAARLAAIASQIHARWQADLADRRSRRSIVRELDTCSDRELNELGFCRADLPAIAGGTYQR